MAQMARRYPGRAGPPPRLEPASGPPLLHSALLMATQMNPTLAALDIAGYVPFCDPLLGSVIGSSWQVDVPPALSCQEVVKLQLLHTA